MKYTKEEFENLFYKADLNHDGGIFNGELLLFLKKEKMDPDPERVRKYVDQFDVSKDGKL